MWIVGFPEEGLLCSAALGPDIQVGVTLKHATFLQVTEDQYIPLKQLLAFVILVSKLLPQYRSVFNPKSFRGGLTLMHTTTV